MAGEDGSIHNELENGQSLCMCKITTGMILIRTKLSVP